MDDIPDDVAQWYNWTVRIRVKKFELGRSFSVVIFLGEIPPDPHQWATGENTVGVHSIYASNPRNEDPDTINNGFIHLNRQLALRLPSTNTFDPDVVKPYLKANLNWDTIDTRKERIEIKSLEVTVLSVIYSKEPGSKYPVAGKTTVHNDITFGRPGGAKVPMTAD